MTTRKKRIGTINVSSFLPKILTEWFQAVIRTRPSDLNRWSEMYFRMKANGEHPPVKPYLDVPQLILRPGGLTLNTLKALALTLVNEFEPSGKIEKMWDILSLEKNTFLEIIKIGKFNEAIKPIEFIGIAAAYLNTRLRDTMILLCDIFNKHNTKGISLDCFVSIYQYLARLNCNDVASPNENLMVQSDEEIENVENETINDVYQSLLSIECHTYSILDKESFYESVVKETADDFLDTESMKGILATTTWNSDNVGAPESISSALNKYITKPTNITRCDDSNYLLSIKKLKENSSDDLLSLLSGSSVISEPDLCVTLSNNMQSINEINETYEQFDGEKMNSELNYFNYDEYYSDVNQSYNIVEIENDEIVVDDIISEINDEIILDEYNNDDLDIEMNEYNNNNTAIGANKDYVVMLALVDNENSSSPNAETNDPEEKQLTGENDSTESEFSLLDRVELDNKCAAEQTDDNNVHHMSFEDNYYVHVGKESSESEASSNLSEVQYLEIDQPSDDSIISDKISIHIEGSMTEADDLAFVTDKNKLNVDQLSLKDDFSVSERFEFQDMDEEGEQNAYMFSESDEYSDLRKSFTFESLKSENVETSEEVYVSVLPGIGPTIPEKQIQCVIEWVTKCAKHQNNYVYDHNLLHFLCPPLDFKSEECNDKLDII